MDIDSKYELLLPESHKKDVDSFLVRLYLYYLNGGLMPMIFSEISRLFIVAFIVTFTVFIFSFVNYGCMLNVSNETPISQCLTVGIEHVPIFIWIIVGIMAIFWGLNLFQLIIDIPELMKIKTFYQSIGVVDIIGTDWTEITFKLKSSLGTDLTPMEISSRIMRKDNYIIAMFNRDLFGLKSNIYYTKVVEWALTFSVWNYLFINDTVRDDILIHKEHHERELKFRIRLCGVIFFLLSPLIFAFLIVYYACSYFEQIKKSPSFLGGRMWTRFASWKFREYNELSHYYSYRIEKGREAAENYVKSFPSPIVQHISYIISFTCASLLMLIGVLSLIDDDILTKITIFDRSLIYSAGLLGILLAATTQRGQKKSQFETKDHLNEIVKHTHFIPQGYDKPAGNETYQEITTLYQYRVVIFLISILGLFIGPLWLMFVLPNRAGDILKFIRDHTKREDKIGNICLFSSFKMEEQLENSTDIDRHKLEKSYMTFQINNPTSLDINN